MASTTPIKAIIVKGTVAYRSFTVGSCMAICNLSGATNHRTQCTRMITGVSFRAVL